MRPLLLGGLVLLLPMSASAAPATEVHYVMGTYLRITVADPAARPAMRECFQAARRLERVFSRHDPTSELAHLHAAAARFEQVSPDFARLLRRSQTLAAATDGAFDVTVGRLTTLWQDGSGAADGARLSAARATVGSAYAHLDDDRLTLAPGTRLDFDGIAKGYAVDACIDVLRAAGLRRALVSFGESSIFALGTGWTVAVRGTDPDRVVGLLHLDDEAASVSAAVGSKGRHIVDPRTGRLLGSDTVAVVVTASATDAEAYTKALLLWGRPGLDRVERLAGGPAVHVDQRTITLGPLARRRGAFVPFARPRAVPAEEVALW